MTSGGAESPEVEAILEGRRLTTIGFLRQCAEDLSQVHLGSAQYKEWRASRTGVEGEPAGRPPSLPTVLRRFGSWAKAVHAADLLTIEEHLPGDRLFYAREAQVLDGEQQLLLHHALSIFLGRTFTGVRQPAYQLCRLVGSAGQVEGPAGAWPNGRAVLRWLGMRPEEIDQAWLLAEGSDSLLPYEIVAAFVPPRLWPALYQIIIEGPFACWERHRVVLQAWAGGKEVDGTPRDPRGGRKSTLEHGGLSAGSIETMIVPLFGFMHAIDSVRRSCAGGKLSHADASLQLLAKWSKDDFPDRPTAEALGACPANTNRDAPSLRLVRLKLQLLCVEIDILKQTAAGRWRLFQPLRDRALIAALAITGLRREAFNNLDEGDFIEAYSFPDAVGPAIVPRPGKTLSRHLKRPKGIPLVLYEWIREYTDFAGTTGEHDCPLWLPTDLPDRERRRRMNEESISAAVRSCFDVEKRRALFDPRKSALERAYSEEHDGRVYSPHQLRHLAEQVGFVVGMDWLQENRSVLLEHGGGLPSNPQVFPDALLDHKMKDLGDRYKDVASERGRLRWARICALGIGEYLIGERGARQGPDIKLIRACKVALAEKEAQQFVLTSELDAVERRVLADPESSDQASALVALIEMTSLARRLSSNAQELERARIALAQADGVRVAISDELTIMEVTDLWLSVETASLNIVPTCPGPEQGDVPVVRDWATLDEFQWALGGADAVSQVTLRRWARGEKTRLASALGLPPGDGMSPPDCVERLSDRKQRVILTKLDWTRLPAFVQENIEAIRRTSGGVRLALI